LNYVRSIAAANDGGKWTFVAAGSPLPLEDESSYRVRTIRDRFTHEMLTGYLAALGVRAFEEDFYRPEASTLVVRVGVAPAGAKEHSLDDVRAEY
jgi:hypothetical protein